MDDTKQIGLKKHKSHRGVSARVVNLDKVYKKLTTVLARDTDHLMRVSFDKKLSESESADLRGYLKLMRDLLRNEKEKFEPLSDAELKQAAEESKE